MKRFLSPTWFAILFAALYVSLFLFRDLGLNWLIYVSSILTTAIMLKRPPLNFETALTIGGTLLSAMMVVWHNSTVSIFTSIIFLFTATGVILEPRFKALHFSGLMSLIHAAKAQMAFLQQISKGVFGDGRNYRKARTALAVVSPVAVIVLFALIYEAANPIFQNAVAGFHEELGRIVSSLWELIDPDTFWSFIIGLFIANFILLRSTSKTLSAHVSTLSETLTRKKNNSIGLIGKRIMGLKSQYRNGIILLAGLNALLLVINLIDINWVWFGFEFEGEYLKQFVHEGTWLLILSIALSIAVVLYYFRGNLNFYRNNRVMKLLTYVWITQNMMLVISVAIRNYWYIHYYGLAYKRIGVVFFLLATMIGLLTVLVKVKNVRSSHFLIRWNTASLLSVLLLMSCFNWDVVIARYNFAHSDRAFVHLNFLEGFSAKALPYLNKSREELAAIDQHNQEMLQVYDITEETKASSSSSMSRRRYNDLYLEPWDYQLAIRKKIEKFQQEHAEKHWLEWNYAEYRANNLLKASG